MRRDKPAYAVVPRDRQGNWLCPGSSMFVVECTRIGVVEQYLEYRKRGVSPQEQAAFNSAEHIVLQLLGQVVAGKDPSEVFIFKRPKKQGRHVNALPSALCAEVLRLQYLHDFDLTRAKDEVARVFEVEVRTVERALKKLAKQALFSEENIRNYEHSLRLRKILA
jgi:hypothetical protein